MIDVVTCPLCNDAFDGGVAYRAHLEDAHGLRDDEGTATVVPEPTPDDDHLSLMAEALLDDRPAADPTPTAESATASPSASASPQRGQAEPVTWPERPSSGRYELATRYGDVALYAPGLLMLLTSVVRLEADVIGFVLLVVGVALIVLGMLLPVVHGRR